VGYLAAGFFVASDAPLERLEAFLASPATELPVGGSK
jgi:hypothetical protein